MLFAQYAVGSINLDKHQVTLSAMRVEAPWVRKSAIDTGRRSLNDRVWLAASRTATEKGFFLQAVGHPEGTVVLLQANETRRGLPYAQAGLFLRLSESGPLLTISMRLPVNRITLLGDSLEVFRGKADVMTAAELRVLGIDIPNGYSRTFCNKTEVDELFTVREVVPSQLPKPSFAAVVTAKGVEVVAIAQPKVRTPRRR